ncbi:MAG: phage capsid protein [Fulvivirga sp.]
MKLKNLFFNLFISLFLGVAIGESYAISPVVPSVAIFCTGLVLTPFVKADATTHAFMAVQKELWTDYIITKYWKANEFIKHAFNADQFVYNGKVVHIPVPGAKPNVEKNRTSLPANITKRTDTDITYSIAEFTSDPTLIPDADKHELSYSKMDSVIGEHVDTLVEDAAEWMLRDWVNSVGGSADVATLLRTSGADAQATLDGATGTRKIFTKEDLKRARKVMNKANVPQEGRYALLDSEMMDQLSDDEDLKKRDSSLELDMKAGVITKLYGFSIMERSSVLTFDNAGTPVVKDPGTVSAATDNAAALCWHKNSVERALGDVTLFEDLGKPEYYGDVYSALIRSGGRLRRANGVVTIVQEHGS